MTDNVDAGSVRSFEVLEEAWTDYELEDGSLVRMRPVLVFISPQGGGKAPRYRVETQVQTWSPPGLRDEEGPRAPSDRFKLEAADEGGSLKAALLQDGESRYRTDRGVVALKVSGKRFHRTGFFDKSGHPVYLIEHSLDVQSPQEDA